MNDLTMFMSYQNAEQEHRYTETLFLACILCKDVLSSNWLDSQVNKRWVPLNQKSKVELLMPDAQMMWSESQTVWKMKLMFQSQDSYISLPDVSQTPVVVLPNWIMPNNFCDMIYWSRKAHAKNKATKRRKRSAEGNTHCCGTIWRFEVGRAARQLAEPPLRQQLAGPLFVAACLLHSRSSAQWWC